MRRTLLLAAVLLMAVLLVPPAAAQEPTLADVLTDSASADTPEFTTLLAALQAADPALLEALADPTVQLTLFAPTDAAFAAQIEAWGEDSYAALLDKSAGAHLHPHLPPGQRRIHHGPTDCGPCAGRCGRAFGLGRDRQRPVRRPRPRWRDGDH